MILVDTSVWIDHLRQTDQALVVLLTKGLVMTHPFVIGELSLGNLSRRETVIDALSHLPCAEVATDAEVLRFIARHALFSRGVGYVDVHLLAGVKLTQDTKLWTRDKRLHSTADNMGVAFTPAQPR